jgi:hypothetical protein
VALDFRRGFRRLYLVLSVVWVVGYGLFLWRFPFPAPPPDYAEIARQCPDDVIPQPATQEERKAAFIRSLKRVGEDESQAALWGLDTDVVIRKGNCIRAKAVAAPKVAPFQIGSWVEVGLLPPFVGLVLLEGLLWAFRGFSATQSPRN